MIWLLLLAAWILLGPLMGFIIGRSAAIADRRELRHHDEPMERAA